MKEYIIIIVVLILVFVPNIFFKIQLESSGKAIIDIINLMEENIENEENKDKELSKKLEDEFIGQEKKWLFIVDHDILDEIEKEIEECIAFYNETDSMEFESSSRKLKNTIEDLVKREEISLSNII